MPLPSERTGLASPVIWSGCHPLGLIVTHWAVDRQRRLGGWTKLSGQNNRPFGRASGFRQLPAAIQRRRLPQWAPVTFGPPLRSRRPRSLGPRWINPSTVRSAPRPHRVERLEGRPGQCRAHHSRFERVAPITTGWDPSSRSAKASGSLLAHCRVLRPCQHCRCLFADSPPRWRFTR
jgi:hypothetical protein